MKSTKFGEVILDSEDIFDGLYTGKIEDFTNVNVDDIMLIEQFNKAKTENADHVASITKFQSPDISIEEFDSSNQSSWFMPDEYKNMEIDAYIISLCKTDEELTRVADELDLFYQHGMMEVLKYLKYLVDTMRSNNIVWGIGRGSAVASYCLYLLGAHKIDSLKYNLDIHEFLK